MPENKKVYGKINPASSLVFNELAGEGEFNGVPIQISTSVPGGYPIVRNMETHNWFSLSWQDVVELAAARGLFTEDPAEVEGGTQSQEVEGGKKSDG